ncbi:MAG: pyridoxamine 5'-phosphate oxidase family protein [Dehalococcoidia bacterium]
MTTSVLMAERPQISSDHSVLVTRPVDARGRGAGSDSYWLATVQPDGRPHILPVLEVWLDGALYVSAGHFASDTAPRADASCYVISVGRDAPDLIVEGGATPVRDGATLRRVAAEYRVRYGWPVSPRAGGFGDEGAGVLPYEVYEATPTAVIGFDPESPLDAARWCF